MLKRSLRVLLEGLIDYAGLFPPAALPMDRAIANYDAYRRGEYAWALGRFVVPFARMAEVPKDFPLSVIVAAAELKDLDDSIDTIEAKAVNERDVARIAGAAEGKTAYVEIVDPDLVEIIGGCGLRAKIRTGGVTPEAIPDVARVARMIRECAAESVPFKATAGLHHPIRCTKPLTYEPNAPVGTMHGFLNVFMAAALIGAVDEEILLDGDPKSFLFGDEHASWRRYVATTELLASVRREFAISFGSCSFEEPIADLKELGWL
jgi:hypothetical protein